VKFISLFAGIGGLDLGLERAGMECVAQVEIDEFCQKILTKHWADVPKFKDVRDVGKHNLPPAELICGGFPCQDVSLAGKRAGLQGKRSTLWSEFHRIVCEVQPRWIVIENVLGLLSSDAGQFFTKILRELSESGYSAEWEVIPASAFGAPHQRERVFIVGYSKSIPIVNHVIRQSHYNAFSKGKAWSAFDSSYTRMADGVPARMGVRVTGNSVVPQVAEFVGYCVMKAQARLTPRALDGGTVAEI